MRNSQIRGMAARPGWVAEPPRQRHRAEFGRKGAEDRHQRPVPAQAMASTASTAATLRPFWPRPSQVRARATSLPGRKAPMTSCGSDWNRPLKASQGGEEQAKGRAAARRAPQRPQGGEGGEQDDQRANVLSNRNRALLGVIADTQTNHERSGDANRTQGSQSGTNAEDDGTLRIDQAESWRARAGTPKGALPGNLADTRA